MAQQRGWLSAVGLTIVLTIVVTSRSWAGCETTTTSSTTSTALSTTLVCCEKPRFGGIGYSCVGGATTSACEGGSGVVVGGGVVCDGTGNCVPPPGTPGGCCRNGSQCTMASSAFCTQLLLGTF